MSPFAEAVELELADARNGHKPINSTHEGYAVILEEMEEFWAEVMKKSRDRNPGGMLSELIQIAAMCQRTAEDCRLIGAEESSSPVRLDGGGRSA